jgi:SulP family sulfate permease
MGTVVNIQTGGRSALSGLTRALILAIVVLWAAELTAHIPLAVLAGIALKVGLDIIDWSFLKRAHRVSPKAAWIMYGVIALTVFVDLITAVALGVFIANVLTIERMVKLQSQSVKAIHHADAIDDLTQDEQTLLERARGRILVFELGGPLIFGVAKAISRKHAVLQDHQVLILDFSDVPLLGVSSSLALEQMILEDLQKGKPVFIAGAVGEVKQRLDKLGLTDRLRDGHVVETRQEALEKATAWLEDGAIDSATAGGKQDPEHAGRAGH